MSFYSARGNGCEVLWWVCTMSGCLSVCLSVRENISTTTRAIFTNFLCVLLYVRGAVFFRHVDDRPHRVSPGRGFFPHWQCIYLRNHTRDLYQVFFVHVAWILSSVLLWRIYEGVFFPIENALSPGKGDRSAQRGRSRPYAIYDCLVVCLLSEVEIF